jgi:hypothetical protein
MAEQTITSARRFLLWKWEETYHGSYTVWRNSKTGCRASTQIESLLADIYAARRRSA